MNASLHQLLNVQSRFAEEATRFLLKIADVVDATPWEFRGRKMRASSASIEPVVLTWREPRSERDEAGGHGEKDGAAKGLSPTDVLLMKQYERERQVGKNEEQRWSQAVRHGGRLRRIITGEPGSGKTCATRYTAAELARESAKALTDHTVDVQEISFPLWITATHLFEQPEGLDVAGAVLGAVEKQTGLSGVLTPSLRSWLMRQVRSERAFIVVDALDELASTKGAGADCFSRRLGELGDSAASLVVTCRTLPWLNCKHLVAWQDARETVELKPLDRRHQRDYSTAFFEFTGQPDLAEKLDEQMQRSLSFREHARTPLILTFACGLFADGKLSGDVSVVTLYNLVVAALLEGVWRSGVTLPGWTTSAVQRERVRLFLGPLAWRLFERAPASNRFNLTEWDADWTAAATEAKAPGTDSDVLLEDLVRLGLLVDGGSDEKGNVCWSFAHRTILEFEAAVGLEKDAAKLHWLLKEQKPIEDNPFWFRPEWLPTLTFLAAIMGDATPLIEAVDIPPKIGRKRTPGDDFFGQMFGLKCRFAGVALETPEALAEGLSSQWLCGWDAIGTRPLEGLRKSWKGYGHLLAGHSAFARAALAPLLALLEREEHSGVREGIADALGALGDRSAVAPLLARLEREEDSGVRWRIALALGALGDRSAVAPLLARLEREEDSGVRQGIADALGALGDRSAAGPLLARLEREGSSGVCRCIARALGALGDRSAAVAPLLARLEREEHNGVDEGVADALGALGDRRAVGPLLARLEDENDSGVRWRIARALGALGGRSAVGPLLARLKDEYDSFVRQGIADALGALGDRSAVAPLLARLKDEYDIVDEGIADALDALGDRSAVAPLLARLERAGIGSAWYEDPEDDEPERRGNSGLRCCIARALGALGDRSAVAPLLARLGCAGIASAWHEDPEYDDTEYEWSSDVRCYIALALGALGDRSAVAPLLARLERENDIVVEGIAHALGALGDRSAVAPLLARLEREQDSSVRGRIADALGALGDRSAVAPLLPRLEREQDSSVRGRIADALGALGDRSAVAPLLARLECEQDSSVRGRIAGALWKISQAQGVFVPPLRRFPA